MYKDQQLPAKPLIDEYEVEEFNQRIAYAMEYNLAAKLSVWDDGLKEVITDKVHYINPLTKQLRVEVKPGEFVLVAFNNIVGVAVSVEDVAVNLAAFLVPRKKEKIELE